MPSHLTPEKAPLLIEDLPQLTGSNRFVEESKRSFRARTAEVLQMNALLDQAQKLLQLACSRPELKCLAYLLFVFMLLNLQACSIMYQPRFDAETGFRAPEGPIGPEEVTRRKTEMTNVLTAPVDYDRHQRLTGIHYDQLRRILDHCQELFEDTSREDFQRYMETCRQARDKLGILNFDRYSPRVLPEVLANYDDVERHRDRPVVIVFLGREDHVTAGIQALNVESHLVERLLDHYKVYLFETSSMTEILCQLNRLIAGGLLPEHSLKGIVFGAHGNDQSSQTGIDTKNLHSLSILSDRFSDDAMGILSNCFSAEDGSESLNLVNRFTAMSQRAFGGPANFRVLGSKHYLMGVDFETDGAGQVDQESLRLRSLSDYLTGGLLENTHRGDVDEIMNARLSGMESLSPIPKDVVLNYFRNGIIDEQTIRVLFQGEVSPERFWEYTNELARLDISLPAQIMVECIKRQITAQGIQMHLQWLGGYQRIGSIRNGEEISQHIARHAEEMRLQFMAGPQSLMVPQNTLASGR